MRRNHEKLWLLYELPSPHLSSCRLKSTLLLAYRISHVFQVLTWVIITSNKSWIRPLINGLTTCAISKGQIGRLDLSGLAESYLPAWSRNNLDEALIDPLPWSTNDHLPWIANWPFTMLMSSEKIRVIIIYRWDNLVYLLLAYTPDCSHTTCLSIEHVSQIVTHLLPLNYLFSSAFSLFFWAVHAFLLWNWATGILLTYYTGYYLVLQWFHCHVSARMSNFHCYVV